jgi:tetratricopeptide (TPR) repeat protein
MSKFISRQWVAVAGGFLLLLALFFINRKAPVSNSQAGQQDAGHAGAAIDFDQVIHDNEDSLPAPEKELIEKIKTALSKSPDSVPHLIQALEKMDEPIIAAYYTEKLAGIVNSPGLWIKAGNKYYDYSGLGKGEIKDALIKQAEQCFNNSLKLDSTNSDALVGLGECQVDLSGSPMIGIGTIEGVLKKDSNNLNAQVALGKLSIRSGQFEKAIYRFNRVLQIDSTYKDAYIYLAQTYSELGNKGQEIANLKKYRIFAPDSAIRAEIDSIIKDKIKNDTTN